MDSRTWLFRGTEPKENAAAKQSGATASFLARFMHSSYHVTRGEQLYFYITVSTKCEYSFRRERCGLVCDRRHSLPGDNRTNTSSQLAEIRKNQSHKARRPFWTSNIQRKYCQLFKYLKKLDFSSFLASHMRFLSWGRAIRHSSVMRFDASCFYARLRCPMRRKTYKLSEFENVLLLG